MTNNYFIAHEKTKRYVQTKAISQIYLQKLKPILDKILHRLLTTAHVSKLLRLYYWKVSSRRR